MTDEVQSLWACAAQGDAEAQTCLGLRYDYGEGVLQDYAEAVRWYRLAAEQGHAGAQTYLALRYFEGRGVPKDDTEAVRWYRLAAEQGVTEAMELLAAQYQGGNGVPYNIVQAYMWISLAGAQYTGERREKAVQVMANLSMAMTPAQIDEAGRLALEWLAAHPRKFVSLCVEPSTSQR